MDQPTEYVKPPSVFEFEKLQLIHFADPILTLKPPLFDFEADGDKAVELAEGMKQKMKEEE